MADIVYLLTNPAMPGLVKIGKTSKPDVKKRMGQLYSTGVPLPFDCALAMEVEDAVAVEKAFHAAFVPNRINSKREFFEINVAQAEALLELVGSRNVTPEVAAEPDSEEVDEASRQASENYKQKRPRMNFEEMNIPIGAQLEFTQGDAVVEVASDRTVRYNGEETSLTAITTELLGREHNVQPSPYWLYRGKPLIDIYNETYAPIE